jgi:hypothetical protein
MRDRNGVESLNSPGWSDFALDFVDAFDALECVSESVILNTPSAGDAAAGAFDEATGAFDEADGPPRELGRVWGVGLTLGTLE